MKSKVKEWERSLTMVGNFPVIGKAKYSQEITTFLQRVAQIVPKGVKLCPLPIERSEVWLLVCFLRCWWTRALPLPCSRAVPDLQWPLQGYLWAAKEASSFLYPFEEEAGEEHTLLLSWSLLWSLGACLAHISRGSSQSWIPASLAWRTPSDHTTRLVLGVVGQDIAINPFNKCSICGLKGVKWTTKGWFQPSLALGIGLQCCLRPCSSLYWQWLSVWKGVCCQTL